MSLTPTKVGVRQRAGVSVITAASIVLITFAVLRPRNALGGGSLQEWARPEGVLGRFCGREGSKCDTMTSAAQSRRAASAGSVKLPFLSHDAMRLLSLMAYDILWCSYRSSALR